MKRFVFARKAVGLAFGLFATLASGQSLLPAAQLAGLKWRNIGPFRAGRVSAVCGIPGNPNIFYAGLPEGGVWKTTSAGQTWYPIFDAIRATSTIGSVQVAPSRPDVIYAGTGEISGGSLGAGVYKSEDAGTTWRCLGLEDTKLIPTILVDPKDADTALVAACGRVGSATTTSGFTEPETAENLGPAPSRRAT